MDSRREKEYVLQGNTSIIRICADYIDVSDKPFPSLAAGWIRIVGM